MCKNFTNFHILNFRSSYPNASHNVSKLSSAVEVLYIARQPMYYTYVSVKCHVVRLRTHLSSNHPGQAPPETT